MRQFQAIIGLLALVTIGAQTLRHAYVLLIEPRESVLDKYEPAKQDIAETKSLEELITLYEAARVAAEEFRKSNPKQPDEERWEYERRLAEEGPAFQSKELLENAISAWESHNQQLYELHFFWAAGVVVSVIATVIYLRIQRWAGICVCLLGTLEMIWATSPSLRTFGSPVEFDRLLTFKLLYSVLTVLFVAGGWGVATRAQNTREECGEPSG